MSHSIQALSSPTAIVTVGELQHRLQALSSQVIGALLIGPPLAGKSTLLANLSKFNYHVASTDDLISAEAAKLGMIYSEYFRLMAGKTDERVLPFDALNTLMRLQAQQALALGQSVIFDQTNMSRSSRSSKLALFKRHGAQAKVAIVVPTINMLFSDGKLLWDLETLQQRNSKRAAETGKSIPEHVLESMLRSYQAPKVDEGFDYIFYLARH